MTSATRAAVTSAPSETGETLQPALLRLDLRLGLAVETFRGELAERARDPLRGLYISEADVDALLAGASPAELSQRLGASEIGGSAPRLDRLACAYGLDGFEQDVLLACLAPEIDLRYERLYAYLQDDVTRKRPTVDLLLRLFGTSVRAREALGPAGTLVREGLLQARPDEATDPTSLLARPLRVDERLVEYLLGSDLLDARLAGLAELIPPDPHASLAALPDDLRGLARLLRPADGQPAAVAYLRGGPGTNKRSKLRAVCAAAGRPALLVEVAALVACPQPRTLLGAACREAVLQDAVLGLDGLDVLLSDDPETTAARAELRRTLGRRTIPCLLLGEVRWEPALWVPEAQPLALELDATTVAERLGLWQRQVDGRLGDKGVLRDLAARYRLDEDAIRAAAAAAEARVAGRGDSALQLDDLRTAARAIAAPPLDGMAGRLEPHYGWSDIVLPRDGLAQLHEVCDRARHRALVLDQWGYARKHARRRGITALFAGPPGTGKTMAAEIIAGELGLALYRVDLSATVSKYIGETEKNLERIFRAADQGDAVVLFDEADALFGRRGEVRDAHDRYANIEVAYLLQRLEAYDGLAILTTNLRGNIDEAFIRRLDAVLEFPLPDEPERLEIWRRSLPPEAPLDDEVPDGLAWLAGKFKLAGGHIRNIVLRAAYLAASDGAGALAMQHLQRAAEYEYRDHGMLIARGRLSK